MQSSLKLHQIHHLHSRDLLPVINTPSSSKPLDIRIRGSPNGILSKASSNSSDDMPSVIAVQKVSSSAVQGSIDAISFHSGILEHF